ncbi:MAG: hypothetical protein RL514_1893 [Verrucomicrobiota bacterium]|jgi:hypothetical protein
MARAYQPPPPESQTILEVDWQQRPRVWDVPVRLLVSQAPPAEQPTAAATELPWVPRSEDKSSRG